jgi:mannose-6-phosphate isomerase
MNDLERTTGHMGQAEQQVNHDGDRVGVRSERPWGAWTLLESGPGYKVKRLEVLPGKRLSLQKHCCRSEHWIVVQGTARVTSADRVFLLDTNQWTFIPLGTVHRLENPDFSPLEVIEIQMGTELRETDIIRLEDDFGRVAPSEGGENLMTPAVTLRAEA